MSYLVPNHPCPVENEIDFLLVYEILTISYNSQGQRLGRFEIEEGQEQEWYCTFFRPDKVIITLKNETTLILFPNMKLDRIINETNTDMYFDEPLFKHAEYDSGHVIHFHFKQFIKPYFELINNLQSFFLETPLIEKYHQEFFLDLYAIFKILGLIRWKETLVKKIMNRIKKEMINDIYHYPTESEFPTINDIIWDELMKQQIIKNAELLKNQ